MSPAMSRSALSGPDHPTVQPPPDHDQQDSDDNGRGESYDGRVSPPWEIKNATTITPMTPTMAIARIGPWSDHLVSLYRPVGS